MNDKIDNLLSRTGDVALRRRARWIINNLKLKNGERILDVGCGDGFYLYLLSNLNQNLILFGVDKDKKALNSAKRNLDTEKIKLINVDLMEKLPFSDNFFDRIIMSEVMEHLPDDLKCMRDIKRVLKKDGKIYISVPHINYPFFWDPVNWILQRIFKTHIKSGFWAGIWNQHIRLYTSENLRSVLEESGFNDIKIISLTHFCLPFNHHIINFGARILAVKNAPSFFKKQVSKFSPSKREYKKQGTSFNPFWVIFKFDILNDKWKGPGSAVSLVAIAKK